jgi:hypothetical protein
MTDTVPTAPASIPSCGEARLARPAADLAGNPVAVARAAVAIVFSCDLRFPTIRACGGVYS